nr:pyrimidine-nucleoside phosphorylase [Veillonella denticariosi]
MMRMYDIILKKRAAQPLTSEEIHFVISGYVNGDIPDYQVSALLMTIVFNGMNKDELGTLTLEMAKSGHMVDLSSIDGVTVDKHSTGGVGDKTTLIIAPLVAACGGKVAKMSGRGLGHTGGTIDKMESIPGLQTEMKQDAFIEQVNRIGLAVIGQSEGLAPADKKLYALRDVTGTVDSIPLIASSVMSKKLASGAQAILLDVKVGSGAFMKTLDDARQLAQAMVDIGKANGRFVKAILTDMDRPLGHAIGNALEIREVIDTLKGNGPEDLTHECLVMAAHMLVLGKICDYDTAFERVQQALDSGAALERLGLMISAQGGDVRVLNDDSLLPIGRYTRDVIAQSNGYIIHMNTEQCGIASVMLGAGRTVKDGPIDYGAGIVMHKKTGDAVSKDDVIATLYAGDESLLDGAEKTYIDAITIDAVAPGVSNTILGIVE